MRTCSEEPKKPASGCEREYYEKISAAAGRPKNATGLEFWTPWPKSNANISAAEDAQGEAHEDMFRRTEKPAPGCESAYYEWISAAAGRPTKATGLEFWTPGPKSNAHISAAEDAQKDP